MFLSNVFSFDRVNIFADESICAYVWVSKILHFTYLSNKKWYEDGNPL